MQGMFHHQKCNRTVFTMDKEDFTDRYKRSKYKKVSIKDMYNDKLVDSIASHYYKRLVDWKISSELDFTSQKLGKQSTVEVKPAHKISRAPVKQVIAELSYQRLKETFEGLRIVTTSRTDKARPYTTKSGRRLGNRQKRLTGVLDSPSSSAMRDSRLNIKSVNSLPCSPKASNSATLEFSSLYEKKGLNITSNEPLARKLRRLFHSRSLKLVSRDMVVIGVSSSPRS